MRVVELWRYPVKSMQGQRLQEAEVGPAGITGDRSWALFDRRTGLGLTARRVPELLFATGRLRTDGTAEVVLPDGTVTAEDDVLSDWLGPVQLRAAADVAGQPEYEAPADDLADAGPLANDWFVWEGAGGGAFHDTAQGRLSLVSLATLGSWDRRRFRANVVVDGAGEDALVGRRVRLGAAVLEVGAPIPRCVLVTRPQPGGITRDTSVLKTVHRTRGGELAVAATVTRPGLVRTGHEIEPED